MWEWERRPCASAITSYCWNLAASNLFQAASASHDPHPVTNSSPLLPHVQMACRPAVPQSIDTHTHPFLPLI